MKRLPLIASVVGGALFLISLFTGSFALLLLLLAAGAGVLAVRTVIKSSKDRSQALSNPSVVKPFAKVRAEIAQIASSPTSSPESRAIAKELLVEADALVGQATQFAWSKSGKASPSTLRAAAESGLAAQNAKIESAETSELRDALLSQAHVKQTEIAHYRSAEHAIDAGWAHLHEALAALSELKAKMLSGSIKESNEVAGMVDRIKTLSKSFDEAIETMELKQQ